MLDERERQRRILRRATLLTGGLALAAVVMAVVGSALIAWFLSVTGLPFRATWLALTLIVLVVPVIGVAVGAIRERRGGEGVGSRE